MQIEQTPRGSHEARQRGRGEAGSGETGAFHRSEAWGQRSHKQKVSPAGRGSQWSPAVSERLTAVRPGSGNVGVVGVPTECEEREAA